MFLLDTKLFLWVGTPLVLGGAGTIFYYVKTQNARTNSQKSSNSKTQDIKEYLYKLEKEGEIKIVTL